MGMSGVLGSALSGLKATQAGVELVSRNITNADLPGYTKKSLDLTPVVSGNSVLGVRSGEVNRQLDLFVQRQMWRESSGAGYAASMARYFTELDAMLAAPGSSTGLDALYGTFLNSLEALGTSTEDATVRDRVLHDAQVLAQALNRASGEVQSLRGEAERGIGEAVDRINELLVQIAKLNQDITREVAKGGSGADLLDLRDRQVAELSRLVDLKVVERGDGSIGLSTQAGASLLDVAPAELVFDERGAMAPQAVYSSDDESRGVGTVRLKSPNGLVIDLIEDRAIRSGELAALIELRDDHLVRAQAQLDAFADGLARALSTNNVASDPLADGREIDASAMLPGDRLALTYEVGGEQRKVTIIRVEDPDKLPLADSATPDPDDIVIGVGFAGGWGAVAAELQDALPDIVVEESGGKLQFRDGPAGTIGSLSAGVTATSFEEGLGLPFFVDGNGNVPYSGSLDGRSQQIGFSGRIKVNPELLADSSRLVRYAPGTASGDPARPLEMVRRLSEDRQHFGHLGANGTAVHFGTLSSYLQRVISTHGANKADAGRAKEAQDTVVAQLEERFTRHSGVNIDEEMARLIELQQAFQASTRVVQAYREMLAMLMQV